MKCIPSQEKRVLLHPQLTKAQMFVREASLRRETCPWTNPSGSPEQQSLSSRRIHCCTGIVYLLLTLWLYRERTQNCPWVSGRLVPTLAQIRTNDNPKTEHHCRLGQTQGLWGHQYHPGSDFRPWTQGGDWKDSHSQVLSFPKKRKESDAGTFLPLSLVGVIVFELHAKALIIKNHDHGLPWSRDWDSPLPL